MKAQRSSTPALPRAARGAFSELSAGQRSSSGTGLGETMAAQDPQGAPVGAAPAGQCGGVEEAVGR